MNSSSTLRLPCLRHTSRPQEHQKLLDQLQDGNIDALYEVAGSLNRRNSEDDRVTSVQLWHALADGPSTHIPSAMALGFSYAEVDKELAVSVINDACLLQPALIPLLK